MADAANRTRVLAERVARHRARLRAKGLRPLQIWVPDTRLPGFSEEARRQSQAVASSERDDPDQDFIDAISEIDV